MEGLKFRKILFTTPIYSPSGNPHIVTAIPHCLWTSISRLKRNAGHRCHLLTVTDEHGQKKETKEKEAELPSWNLVELLQTFKKLWE
jgi:methionyl-tRNA synthetase